MSTTPARRPEQQIRRIRGARTVSDVGRAPKDTVTVTPYRDGPLLVRGPVRLIGPDGTPVECHRDPIALCRCGRSQLKPFCDGTHKLIGFSTEDGV
jgi:CDGSH-type Zn-finger protein